MRWLAVGLLALGWSLAVSAAVYKWVDENGNTLYSDRPQPGAQEVQGTGAVQTVESFKGTPSRSAPAAVPGAVAYDSVEIAAPAANATFRDNGGNVSVMVALTPPLQRQFGHRLALFVDGKPHGKPGFALSFRLSNVERGTHQLRAVVVDKDGREIASASSTFHMHRTSIKKKPAKPAPPKPPSPKPPAPKPSS